jgi:hypothetical protein
MKMDTVTSKLIVSGMLFLSTVLSGFAVSHAGRPINGALFTVHKLIAVAAVIVTVMAIRQLDRTKAAGLSLEIGAIAISAVLFLALVVTGALLSRDIQLPAAILTIHQVAPALLFIFSSITIILFANKSALPIS